MDGNAVAQRLTDDPAGFIRRSVETGMILIRQEDGWLAIHKDETVPQLAYHYSDIGGWDTATDRFLPLRVRHVGCGNEGVVRSGRETMKWMFAAVCAAAVVLAAPARADGNQYLADLASHGVPMVSQGNALDQGLKVCEAMRAGVTPEQTFGNFGVFTGFAPTIVDLAQHDLCPDTLGGKR